MTGPTATLAREAAAPAPARLAAVPAARREAGKAVLVALAVLGGVLMAAQGRVNATLAASLGDPFLTAVVSFGGAFLVVAVAMLCSRQARHGYVRALREGFGLRRPPVHDGGAAGLQAGAGALPRGGGRRRPRIRWFHLHAGVAGAFFTVSQGMTIGTLGVAVFMIALVAGQSVASLFVDRFGLAPSGPIPLTLARVAGPVLAIAATVVSVAGSLNGPSALWLAVFPFVSGAGQSLQNAFTGHVRGVAAAPAQGSARSGQGPAILAAGFQNFAVGFPILVIAYAVALVSRGAVHEAFPSNPVWYLGGPLAVAFLAIASGVVHRIGALQLALGLITGQTVGALALDLLAGHHPAPTTYVAAVLTLTAVSIPVVAGSRTRRA